MAMTYTTLTAAKGAPGALQTWINYSKLNVDVGTILDESQALLYSMLRCREMRSTYRFTMPVNNAVVALPTGFLDPIGRMYAPTFNMEFRHKDESFLQANRNYTQTIGTLGTNPFTTTAGSNTVAVNLAQHGFNQESSLYTTGATAFNGVTISGTFPITSIIDANNFKIDISVLGATPSGSGAGGGTAAIYTCDNLVQGTPLWWAIFDEAIHFDASFNQITLCELFYFKSMPLLSATNLTNFLTTRYPFLLREACLTQAADWMKDTEEHTKHMQKLTAMVGQVSIENDMMYRGAEINTDTP